MKLLITITIALFSLTTFAQKTEVKKDTLIITNYENISFIKIAGKTYRVKTELQEIQPEPQIRGLWQPYSSYPSTTLTGIDSVVSTGTMGIITNTKKIKK